MGNFTNIAGKINFKDRDQMNKFKQAFDEFAETYGWLKSDKLFIEEIIADQIYCYLHINPLNNSFKLIGYPQNFDELLGFFKAKKDSFECMSLQGAEESSGLMHLYIDDENEKLWLGSRHDEDEAVRINGWHEAFKNKLKGWED